MYYIYYIYKLNYNITYYVRYIYGLNYSITYYIYRKKEKKIKKKIYIQVRSLNQRITLRIYTGVKVVRL